MKGRKRVRSVPLLVVIMMMAAFVTFIGLAIGSIGEGFDTKQPVYFSFAILQTIAIPIGMFYALSPWAKAGAGVVCLWALSIFVSLSIMNLQGCARTGCTITNPVAIVVNSLAVWEVWIPIGIAGLCMFEASSGTRFLKLNSGDITGV